MTAKYHHEKKITVIMRRTGIAGIAMNGNLFWNKRNYITNVQPKTFTLWIWMCLGIAVGFGGI